MVMTDPIADMLTRIRNANQMKHASVTIPASKMKMEFLRVLKEEGYISDFNKTEDNKQGILTVTLRYVDKVRAITGIKRISKPGLRVYAKSGEIPKVLNGLGIAIVSTSNGLMTDRAARSAHLGGEVVAFVW